MPWRRMGSGCIDPYFLDLRTCWRWLVRFKARPLYSQERTPCTHWIGGWVDSRTDLVDTVKKKFLTLPGLEPRSFGPPAPSQSLSRLRYPDILFRFCRILKLDWDRCLTTLASNVTINYEVHTECGALWKRSMTQLQRENKHSLIESIAALFVW
jgi:hypothetical protein